VIALADGADAAVAADRVEPRGLIDQLLRDRPAVIARIATGDGALAVLRAMITTIAVTMAIVGAALGSYRGGVQIAFAAIKLPLVLLGTAALSAPALTAIGAALGRRARLASDAALVMTALAYGALLLVACAPLIMLARAGELPYHDMILAVVAMFAVAGLASLRMIARAVARERAPGAAIAVLGFALVFATVGSQLAWALRPYLVRPRATDVVFVHPTADSLYDAITGSLSSARGVYARARAPLSERGE
jgi:hypothetical protein